MDIIRLFIVVFMIVVFHPLLHVSTHVINTQGIRFFLAYRICFAKVIIPASAKFFDEFIRRLGGGIAAPPQSRIFPLIVRGQTIDVV
jgi:hypothetical protein